MPGGGFVNTYSPNMSTHKTTNPELKARLEKALRENLRKRKSQQRERKEGEKLPLQEIQSHETLKVESKIFNKFD